MSWYWLSTTTVQNRKSLQLLPAYLKWLIAVPKAEMTLPWYLCYKCLFSHNMFSWCSQLPVSNPLHMCRHEESVCFLLAHVAGESSQPESRLNLSWSAYPMYRRASGKLKHWLRFSLLWGSHQSFTHRYFMGQLRNPIFFCLAWFSSFCVPVCVLFSGGEVCLVWWSGGALSSVRNRAVLGKEAHANNTNTHKMIPWLNLHKKCEGKICCTGVEQANTHVHWWLN